MSRKIELDLRVNGLDTVEKQVSQLQKSLSIMKQQLQNVDAASNEYKMLTESIKETEEAINQMNGATEQSTEANMSLRAQLRAVREELQGLEPGSQRFQELSERAGQLTDQISDTQAVINATAGSPLENLATGLGTATRVGLTGFQGIQGVMQLVGGESEDLMKAMAKLQATMALTQVLKDFGAMKDTLVTLRASFTAFSRGAMAGLSGIQKAIIATGIGALVVAIGLLVAYWDDIKGLVSGITPELKEQNRLAEENVKEKEKQLAALDNQTNILKLQGKSEKEILQLRIAATKELIEAQKIRIKNLEQTAKMEIAAAERNQNITRQILRFGLEVSALALRALAAPIDLLLEAANQVSSILGFGEITSFRINDEISKMLDGASEWGASLLFDADEVRKKNEGVIAEERDKLEKLENAYAGHQLQLQQLDKAAADKSRTESERRSSERLSQYLKDLDRQEKARRDAEALELAGLKGFARVKRQFELEQNKLEEEYRTIANAEAIEKLNERFVKENMTIAQYAEERRKLEQTFTDRLTEAEKQNLEKALADLQKRRLEATESEAKRVAELRKKYAEQFNKDERTAYGIERDLLVEQNNKKLEALKEFYDDGVISKEEYDAKIIELEKKLQSDLDRVTDKEKLSPYIGLLNQLSTVFSEMAGEASGWITNLSSTLVGGVGAVLELTLQEFKTNGEKIAAYAQVIGSVIQGVFSAIGQAQKDNVNQNLQNVQESFNQEASALEDLRKKGQVTEEQYARSRYEIELAAFNKAEELKKAAFEADKGLRISQTIASGAQGAVAAFASAMTIPPPAGQIIGGVLAGIMGAMTLANVGIIASQKYQGGAPPQIAQPQLGGGGVGGTNISQLGGSQLFGTAGLFGNLGGTPQQGGQMQVRAYVVESDITGVQNTITTLEERAEFG